MSWLFSRALVAAFSEENSWDGEPSAQLNVMPTQHKFWRNDKTMDTLSLSRFGLTLQVLTESRGAELLMWFRADFPAKTYPSTAPAKALKAREADCGESLRGFLAKYDPFTHSWKTAQLSLLADLESSLQIWPRWGSMRSGECWERTAPGWITYEKGCGLLPTPLATDYKGGTAAARKDNGKLRLDQWRDYVRIKHGMTYPHPTHTEVRMGWPEEWTDLKPLGTDRFQKWLRLHGNRFVADDWKKVVFSADCDDDGNCPVCAVDYAECTCPGPTQDDEYEYMERDGELFARRLQA